MDRKALLLITFFVEGGLFLFGLLLMGGSGALRSQFSFSWSAIAYALLLCLPMLASLYFVVRSRWAPLSRLLDEIEEKVMPIFANCNIVDLAFIAFLAGVGEELFFRGWMQALLVGRSGVVIGILVTSLVFGILHYLSTAYFVYAFITGIYLGIIYFATDNLFIVMAIHTIYDFIALMYLVRMKKQSQNKTAFS
jgi:membrane protease YdiL (CAAX protease family)